MQDSKKHGKGRASGVVVAVAIAALGASALATPAAAIEDNGQMVEENALLLHGQILGFGENGFYLDPTVFLGPFKAAYVLFHQALVAPVAILGGVNGFFGVEGYQDQ